MDSRGRREWTHTCASGPSTGAQAGTRILVRIIVNALAVAAADAIVDGIRVGSGTVEQWVVVLLGVAVVFG